MMPTTPTAETLRPLLQRPIVDAVRQFAEKADLFLYLVGGCIRDFLQAGTFSDDLDFAVVRSPERPPQQKDAAKQLAQTVAKALSGAFVPLDPEFGIYRVVLHQHSRFPDHGPGDTPENTESIGDAPPPGRLYLDFSDALENDIAKDLARRDVTMNAMALSLHTGELLDPFHGLDDLQHRVVRMIHEDNLRDDPLRLVRIFRLMSALDIQAKDPCQQGQHQNTPHVRIDPKTLSTVQALKDSIHQVAVERVQYELYRLVSTGHCFNTLITMGATGLLETLFPEFIPMHAIPPNGHHHLDLYAHTLELVRQAEQLVLTLPKAEQAYFAESFENTAITRLGLVILSCLFHDIGKPATKEEKQTATGLRFTYYGHDQVSETMTDAIAKRLKMGARIREHLKLLVRWHLYPCQFGPESPRRSVLRFFRRMDGWVPDLLLLALADRHSTLGPDITPDVLQRSHDNHLWLLHQYREEQTVLRMPRLLDGKAVMDLLNLPPGPNLKILLNALQEAQQLGEIHTPTEAESWLKTHHQDILKDILNPR